MLAPRLLARIEKRRHLAGRRINSCQVGSFVRIAMKTGPRQICQVIGATMLLRSNVFDVKIFQHGVLPKKSTEFAAVARARANQFACRRIHVRATRLVKPWLEPSIATATERRSWLRTKRTQPALRQKVPPRCICQRAHPTAIEARRRPLTLQFAWLPWPVEPAQSPRKADQDEPKVMSLP
jgi:hypothetical protein